MLFRKKRSKIMADVEMKEYDYVPQTNICDSLFVNK
jgi:hypothetical protein